MIVRKYNSGNMSVSVTQTVFFKFKLIKYMKIPFNLPFGCFVCSRSCSWRPFLFCQHIGHALELLETLYKP